MPLAVAVIDEIAAAHRDRALIGIGGAAAAEHVHEVLCALVMVVGRLGAGRVNDHLALDRLGAEQLGRYDVDPLARVVLRVEHRLARPVDDAEAGRVAGKIGVEARGVGHLRVEQCRAASAFQRAPKPRRQEHDVRIGQTLVVVRAGEARLALEHLEPNEVPGRHVDVAVPGGPEHPSVEQYPAVLDARWREQTLTPGVPAKSFGGDGAFVQGDRHDESSGSTRMPGGKPIIVAFCQRCAHRTSSPGRT